MLDIGLFELLVVGGVGLVVIGPERLPGAIKTGALWVGRVKRSILETRREIEQSIGADEIRRELRNEEIMASLEKLREARTQLEEDIKAHATGDTLEHHDDEHHSIEHDSDQHEHDDHFEEQHNEYSDGSYHHDDDANVVSKTKASDDLTQASEHSAHTEEDPSPSIASTKEADKPAAKS